MEVLIQIVSFIELCVVTVGGINYLIVVEGGRDRKETTSAVSLVQTYWHIWQYDPAQSKFRALPRQTVYLPAPSALRLCRAGESVYGLVESNSQYPLAALMWKDIAKESLKFPEIPDFVASVQLTPAQTKQVVDDSVAEWSTPQVPPAQCLFNPFIASLDDGRIMMTFNAANGDAIIREYDSVLTTSTDRLAVRGALEPVCYRVESKNYLVYRQVAAPTSVFFGTPRHALSAVLEEAALCLQRFDDLGDAMELHDLSGSHGIAPCYMFDLGTDGHQKVAIATVSGNREKPGLTLYLSEDNGRSWQAKKHAALRSLPWRLSLSMNEDEATVGVVFMTSKGFDVGVIRVVL